MGVQVAKRKYQRRKRRSFSDEYKAEVVELVRTSDRSIGEIAEDLDLTETAVRAWVQKADAEHATETEGAVVDVHAQLRAARKEIKQLKMEREVLEKRRPSSRRKTREVRVHPRGEGQLPDRRSVQAPCSSEPLKPAKSSTSAYRGVLAQSQSHPCCQG